ncbi:MAG: hypothetical protein QME85_07435 [Candidatus Saccharicenans sp.]|nr:hypothetical protein [Candidatus Saccharicenans sp.]MDI6849004.1 hypothetical protein [Candidatus Saccharicenans sp.]
MPVEPKTLLIIIAVLLTLSSCLVVAVEKTDREAELELQKARQRILKLSLSSSTSLRPHRLKMLVYDPDDGQLLRISLPLWLVRKGLSYESASAACSHGPDFDFDHDGFNRAVFEMPRGLLAEVLTDREKVLLWLE